MCVCVHVGVRACVSENEKRTKNNVGFHIFRFDEKFKAVPSAIVELRTTELIEYQMKKTENRIQEYWLDFCVC